MHFALEAVASACPEIGGKKEEKKTHDEAITPIQTDAVTNTSALSPLPIFPKEKLTKGKDPPEERRTFFGADLWGSWAILSGAEQAIWVTQT